jgi:protein-tyrosine phosphatase
MNPDLAIRYLKLSMRDQVDSDITFYLYAVIEFIEEALRESSHKAKILVHCFKVCPFI